MELRHLRYLVALAEELHFGRAATRLHISQPPLSQQIRQLESELGVQLFERTKRKVRLTEAGSRVVNEAQYILSRTSHLEKVAAKAGGGEIGQLAVGVSGGSNEILVQTLRLLGKKHAGLRIDLKYLTTGEQIEAIREGRIGVGFLNLPVLDPSLALEKVGREPLLLAIPKGHRLARYKCVPLAQLAEEKMILFPRRVSPGLHDVITGMFHKEGLMLNVVHEVDNVVGGLTLVSANLGIAFAAQPVKPSWPDIVFRPIQNALFVEQAAGYLRDSDSPVLETFLRAVRHCAGIARTAARTAKTRSWRDKAADEWTE